MAQDVVGLGSLLEASFKQHRDCLFILVWDSDGGWAGAIAGKPAPTGVSAGFGFLVIGLASSRAGSLPQDLWLVWDSGGDWDGAIAGKPAPTGF